MPTDSVSTPQESQRHRQACARVGMALDDKWQLDELLGVGGMAAVYAATHRNGRRAALKILHPTLSEITELRDRFFDEAYAANRVAHPGTVGVLDDGVCPDGSLYLVMDLLEGENLEARLARADHGLPPAEVLALMVPLLDVLAAAHDRGVLHRDVKPENVFLTTAGEVKLLDFGIARMSGSRRTSRTRVGLTLGTPSFMPPEQARGRCTELDARADVWAAGATMFTLLTARYVHTAETQNEALLAAMSHHAPPLRTVAPHVPTCVAEVVDRALAFDREGRFRDARAMLRALRSAQRTLARLERRSPPHPRAREPIAPLRFAPLEAPAPGAHQSVTLVTPHSPSNASPTALSSSTPPVSWRGAVALGAVVALTVSSLGAGYVDSPVRFLDHAFGAASLSEAPSTKDGDSEGGRPADGASDEGASAAGQAPPTFAPSACLAPKMQSGPARDPFSSCADAGAARAPSTGAHGFTSARSHPAAHRKRDPLARRK